jgi:hypothetical protein
MKLDKSTSLGIFAIYPIVQPLKLKSMKRKLFSIILSRLLTLSLVFVACNRGTKELTPTATKQNARNEKNAPANPYAIYGQMHNAAMTHIKNYQLSSNSLTKAQKVEEIKNEIKSFILANYTLTTQEQTAFINSLNVHKDFLITSNLVTEFMGKYQQMTTNLQELENANLIDNFEHTMMLRLLSITKLGLENRISFSECSQNLDSIKNAYQARNYPTNGTHGAFLGTMISVGISSRDWWQNNPLEFDGNLEVTAFPIYTDLTGAVVGGSISAISQGFSSAIYGTEWSAWNFWTGVIAGAAVGSSGAIGRIGKLLGDK